MKLHATTRPNAKTQHEHVHSASLLLQDGHAAQSKSGVCLERHSGRTRNVDWCARIHERYPNPNVQPCLSYAGGKKQARRSLEKKLIQLATCIVSEIFISDYLHQLSEDFLIQPLNRETVAAHRHDELAHSQIFKSQMKCLYGALNNEQRRFFAEILPLPILFFADLELDIWHRMLVQLQVSGATEMIKNCRQLNQQAIQRVDYSGVTALAAEVGMLDDEAGRRRFVDHGLMLN